MIRKFSWKDKKNPQDLPTACVVRYGAYGDTIQAMSVIAQLKKDGYHVTLLTQHPSHEGILLDPNIDRLVIQTQNQVPMAQLGMFWPWFELFGGPQHKKFDKWVNLTESVEANLLALPGNIRFVWTPKARHELMDFNYLEHQHNLAGCEYNPSFTFYSNDEEKRWRKDELEKIRKAGIKKYILWPLAGSSRTHKIYPHAHAIWDHVLKHYPEWGVVTTGDHTCKALETSFEGRPRMWLAAGKYTFRQTMLLMETADVVIGPETGVMSGAAFYPMPKVALLTHSTVKNLTRDWVNTVSLWAPKTVCPGRGDGTIQACHKMLPTFEGCRQNEKTMVAQCSTETLPEWVWEVLQACMNTGKAPEWSPP